MCPEGFQKALDELALKFPVKEISEATGFSKGWVSGLLNTKEPMSDAFLRKFCSVYQFDFQEMKRGKAVRYNVPIFNSNEELVKAAISKMLFQEVAELKAHIFFKGDLNAALADMRDHTNSIITSLAPQDTDDAQAAKVGDH